MRRDGVYVYVAKDEDEAMKENGSYDSIQSITKFEEGKTYFIDLVIEDAINMRIVVAGEKVYLLPADDCSIDEE